MESKLAKSLTLAGLGSGLFLFWFMAAVDFTFHSMASWLLDDYRPLAFLFHHLAIPYVKDRPYSGMGPLALFGFALAAVCCLGLRRKSGGRVAAAETVLLFAAPMLVLFEFGLWHSHPKQMWSHATDFTEWKLDGRYVLSNFTLLFSASCLLLGGANWKLGGTMRRSSRGRSLPVLSVALSCVAVAFLIGAALWT